MGRLVAALVVAATAAALAAACSAPGPPVATPNRSRTAAVEPSASAQQPAPVPRRVELQVGHCYVEPVDFAGRRWGLRFSDQFGWGGPQYYPQNWTGTGVLTQVTPDRVRYTDAPRPSFAGDRCAAAGVPASANLHRRARVSFTTAADSGQ